MTEYLKKISWYSDEYLTANEITYKINPEYPSIFRTIFGAIPYHIISKDNVILVENYKKLKKLLNDYGFIAHEQGSSFFNYVHLEKKMMVFGDISDSEIDDEDDNITFPLGNTPDYVSNITINFCPNLKYKNDILSLLTKIEKLMTAKVRGRNNFYMIAQNQRGLYNLETKFKSIPIKSERFDLFYGVNFPHEKISKFINEDTENLLLLHGDPGTGKSNYIKHIITASKRNVIYIPPTMLSVISSPDFISYMMENRGSILLIEDAEEVLSVDRNSATNNLLGLTDGFLKDSLDLKVIATFNCPLNKIDPALMRKGRLYYEYKFDKLTVDEVRKLVDFMGIDVNPTGPMTLAEIFNPEETSMQNSFEERRMGFM